MIIRSKPSSFYAAANCYFAKKQKHVSSSCLMTRVRNFNILSHSQQYTAHEVKTIRVCLIT